MLGEKGGDFRIGGEPCDEDEPICQRWVHFHGLEVKLVTPQARHHQVADHGVVLVSFDLKDGLLAVMGDVNKEVFVGEDPLQGGGELLVVIHQ